MKNWKKHSQRKHKQKQKQLNKCFPPPNLFNTLSPMCYPICTRERKIPAQSSSSSSFWKISRLIASKNLQRLAILRKFSTLWLTLDREQHSLDRDQSAPNSSNCSVFGSWTPVFFQNDLIKYPKTSFHDFHDLYIKS